jgi:hypothetical protein
VLDKHSALPRHRLLSSVRTIAADMSEEKLALLEGEDEFASNPAPRRSLVARRPVTRGWSVALAGLLTVIALGLWSTTSFSNCHRVQPQKSVKDRVHKILSDTPLIGV